MDEKTYNVLFICTGNTARSILAEGLMNHYGRGRFRAFSAGSHAVGVVNRFALDELRNLGLPTNECRSKGWEEFAQPDSPSLDFVFTVCDKAAGEICPTWPGQPMTAHWGLPDPAVVLGDDADKRKAFKEAAVLLGRRIQLMLALPMASLDAMSLQRQLRDIGNQ